MEKSKNGCIECVRFGFIVLNTAVFFTGILLALLGLWFYSVPASENLTTIVFHPANKDEFRAAILLVVSVGGGTCALSIIGCCAAFSRSKCILITLFCLTAVLIMAGAVVLGFGIVYRDVISSDITERLRETLAMDYAGDNANNAESAGWSEMQKYFSCCGISTADGYKNHSNVQYENFTGSLWYRNRDDYNITSEWPKSCCRPNNETYDNTETCPEEHLNEIGCSEPTENFLQNHLIVLIVLTAILLFYEMLSGVLSYILYRDYLDKENRTIALHVHEERKEYSKFDNASVAEAEQKDFKDKNRPFSAPGLPDADYEDLDEPSQNKIWVAQVPEKIDDRQFSNYDVPDGKKDHKKMQNKFLTDHEYDSGNGEEIFDNTSRSPIAAVQLPKNKEDNYEGHENNDWESSNRDVLDVTDSEQATAYDF